MTLTEKLKVIRERCEKVHESMFKRDESGVWLYTPEYNDTARKFWLENRRLFKVIEVLAGACESVEDREEYHGPKELKEFADTARLKQCQIIARKALSQASQLLKDANDE